MHFFKPITSNTNIKTVVYYGHNTVSSKDFDFYDHDWSYFSCCPVYKSNPENETKGSIIKQKGRSKKLLWKTYFLFVIVKKKNMSISINYKG